MRGLRLDIDMDADIKQDTGERRRRRIAFVFIPHIFAESEEARVLRRAVAPPFGRPPEGPGLPLVIVSGSFPRSVIIDYSKALEGSSVKKGAFAKSIEPLRERIRVQTADHEYIEETHRKIVALLKN